MTKKIKVTLAVASLFVLAFSAQAATIVIMKDGKDVARVELDSKVNLNIASDNVVANTKEKSQTYTGHVVVKGVSGDSAVSIQADEVRLEL